MAVVAGYCYGRSRFRTVLALWVPFMAGNVWLSGLLLWSDAPGWFWAVAVALAGVPAFMLAVIVADLRYGLFPLDTFFGVIAVVFVTPGYFLLNLALLAML